MPMKVLENNVVPIPPKDAPTETDYFMALSVMKDLGRFQTFSDRAAEAGAGSEQIEDRRGEFDPLAWAMGKVNDTAIGHQFLGGESIFHDTYHARQPGSLAGQAGSYDIPGAIARDRRR